MRAGIGTGGVRFARPPATSLNPFRGEDRASPFRVVNARAGDETGGVRFARPPATSLNPFRGEDLGRMV